jgi:uncharacterized protein
VEEFLLVDGYNIVNSWPELKAIASDNLENAREKLIDIMQNYQAYKGINIIIVFDAHHSNAAIENIEIYGNIQVIYTRQYQTADQYIEKWVNDMGKYRRIRVATSDYMEQTTILSRGGIRMSARELLLEVELAQKELEDVHINKILPKQNLLSDRVDKSTLAKLEKLRRQNS